MKFGDFELAIIRESEFRLDGGAMFGVVPKTLWNKVSPADERNRIPLSCNLLLIDTGREKILIETGMGDRWEERERDRYDLRTRVDFSNVVAELGLNNDQIDVVVISHLHFV
jgi:glyoxylase-like metal-dependent hydrolase (beta-lactamase superfamily II)